MSDGRRPPLKAPGGLSRRLARGIVHSERPHTRERRGRSDANADARHETHGEGGNGRDGGQAKGSHEA
jgi:hypothetical protein